MAFDLFQSLDTLPFQGLAPLFKPILGALGETHAPLFKALERDAAEPGHRGRAALHEQLVGRGLGGCDHLG